ncbi:MAG: GWxTD domain-containing protein [Acidobacteriota bacterium]
MAQSFRIEWGLRSLLALGLCTPLGAGTPLSAGHKRWLKEEVDYIISARERNEFLKLRNEEQRQGFIQRFWEIRDPDPSTQANEYRQEHYRRIDYANQRFHAGRPGWKSDRGRILIMHGPPDDITFIFGGDQLSVDIDNPTEVLTNGQKLDRRRQFRIGFVRPASEIWIYRHLDGARSNAGYFQIIFSRVDPSQLYQLNQIMRKLGGGLNPSYPSRVSRDTAIMSFMNAQRMGGPFRILYAGEYRYPDVDTFYQSVFHPNRPPILTMTDLQQGLRDLERSPGDVLEEKLRRQRRLRERVQARISFESFEMDLSFAALRSDHGSTLLPVTVGIDSSHAGDELDLLLELVRDGEPVASLVDTFKLKNRKQANGEGFLYQTRLAARPGSYTLRAYGFLNGKGSVSFREYPVELPDYGGRGLGMSDVLLFDKVLPRTGSKPAQASRFMGGSKPIYLKDFVLVPAADNRFRRRERLTAFFEVYNPGIADGARGPSLDLQCRLWQGSRLIAALSQTRLDYFTESRTSRGGLRLTSYGLSIPLQRLRPGKYALELEVHDTVLGQNVSRKASFWIY